MGIDACIYVKVRNEDDGPPSASDVYTYPVPENPGYYLYSGERNWSRLYTEAYPKGEWPSICATLLELLGNPNTEAVYYQGDCDIFDPGINTPITLDDINELSRLWVGGLRYE